MGKLTLHTGCHGSYYYFKDKIIENLSIDTQPGFLYLLPVNRAVRYFKKKLASEIWNKSVLDPPVFTFRSFLRDLYDHSPLKKKIISPSMRLLLLQHILNKDEGQFNYFPNHVTFANGLIIKTERMIEEFFQFGFRPEDFNDPPPTADKKFTDFGHLINKIFGAYQGKLIDETSLISEGIYLIEEDIISDIYPALKKVYISGFGIYSPPMLEFIRHLKKKYEVDVKLEYNSDNMELFKHTADAYEGLSGMADEIIEIGNDLERFARNIFKPLPTDYQKDNFPYNLEIQSLRNRHEEIQYIAAKIKQLHHLEKIPLHEIGITFPDLEKYVPFINITFKDHDIPFNLSTGFNLAESSLIQSFMQVLKIVVSHFETNEIYKLALSPFLKQKLTEEADMIMASTRKIRLNSFQTNWEQKIRDLFGPGIENELLVGLKNKISEERLEKILGNISTLLSTIKPLAGKHSAEEFQKTYSDVLKGLGLLDWYDHDQGTLSIREREREFRAFNRFIKLLDQIVWILKYIHGSAPLDIRDFFNYLTIVFENSTYNLREWSDYGVQIMPRLEILSLELNTLFIGGLVEGDFPRHFTKDIFFSDEERALIGLNASEDLLGQDRFIYYQLLTSGARNIHLCFPINEGDKNLLQSTFITSLQEVFSSIEIMKKTAENKFLSRSSVPEYLSQSLKSEISDGDKEVYLSWITDELPERVRYWINGIRSLDERRSYRQITNFEGNLTYSKEVQRKLAENQIKHIFSITALESYAFCPMQYFLQRILHLEPDEDTGVTITSLERGNAIHKVLYDFYNQLSTEERNKPWEHDTLLKQIATEIFNVFPYDDILWIVEKEKFFGSPTSAGLWEKFLDTEKTYIHQSGFLPTYFESKFEYSSNNDNMIASSSPLVSTRNGQEIRIYGKIDRIDMDEKRRFIVVDYKSGQGAMKISVKDMLDGSSLQLPVYLVAAENLLGGKQGNVSPAAGMYYQVQDGDNCKFKFVMIDRKNGAGLIGSKDIFFPNPKYKDGEKELTFDDIVERTFTYIWKYVDEMANGNFRHTSSPRDKRCTSYCSYNRICRKDTGKLLSIQE